MQDKKGHIEGFISHLYLSASRIPPESFRLWAIEQLQRIVNFDAAFWGTGRLQALKFNYVEQMGLDEHYGEKLVSTLDINPIKGPILSQLGSPVLMSEVFPEQEFYTSELYHKLFQPYGIERILASGHYDERSGLYTLLSLYRFDRDDDFNTQEKDLLGRLLYHMVTAASYAFFLHLDRPVSVQDQPTTPTAWAICDSDGYYHEVQPRFLDFIEQYFPNTEKQRLPFPLHNLNNKANEVMNGLAFSIEPHEKLIRIGARPASVIDQLTEREREVVTWITQGLTYKEVARKIGVAPSTVSNHLYRVYNKLGISSKTELVQIKAQLLGQADTED